MASRRNGDLSESWYPELDALRDRSRRRNGITRMIMLLGSCAAGILLASLVYVAVWLLSWGSQTAAGEARAHVANRIASTQ